MFRNDRLLYMKESRWYVLLGIVGLLLAALVLLRSEPDKPHTVTLTWQAPAARSGITVIGYNVYRRPFESSSFARIADRVTAPPYEDRFVNTGTTYIYVVTSVDATGRESSYSKETKAEIPRHRFLY